MCHEKDRAGKQRWVVSVQVSPPDPVSVIVTIAGTCWVVSKPFRVYTSKPRPMHSLKSHIHQQDV